jgi:hypothetical protein
VVSSPILLEAPDRPILPGVSILNGDDPGNKAIDINSRYGCSLVQTYDCAVS